MFNGRISEVGVLLETGRRLVVRAPKTAGSLAVGWLRVRERNLPVGGGDR